MNCSTPPNTTGFGVEGLEPSGVPARGVPVLDLEALLSQNE